MVKHALSEENHKILFGEVKLLATSSGYYSRLVREAIEIHKHTDNFNNKKETLKLNQIWNPIFKRTITQQSIKTLDPKTRPLKVVQPTTRSTSFSLQHWRWKNLRRSLGYQSVTSIGAGRTLEDAHHIRL